MIQALEQKNKWTSEYEQLLNSMMFIYSVAIFDALLIDSIKIILLDMFDVLKSNKTMSFEQILEFNSLEELRESMAERELLEFSFKSFREQCKYLNEKFKLVLDSSLIKESIEIIETRNIYVHNSGKINFRYIKNTENNAIKIGDLKKLDDNYLQKTVITLKNIMHLLINQLIEKFSK